MASEEWILQACKHGKKCWDISWVNSWGPGHVKIEAVCILRPVVQIAEQICNATYSCVSLDSLAYCAKLTWCWFPGRTRIKTWIYFQRSESNRSGKVQGASREALCWPASAASSPRPMQIEGKGVENDKPKYTPSSLNNIWLLLICSFLRITL